MVLGFQRASRLLLSLSLLALATPSGCAGGDADACERNSDCDHGYCLDEKCRHDCVDAALDCPKGYQCSAIGKCEFEGTSGGAGGTAGAGGVSGGGAAGSSGGGGAAAGKAGAGAGGAGSTQGGAAGVAGAAGQSGAATAGTGGTTTAGSGGTQGGTAGQSAGGMNPFGGGGTTAGTALELDACSGDTDCKPGLLCRADAKGEATRCTRTCSNQAECLGGRRCEQIDGANVCVLGDVGRPCVAPTDCDFGCLLGPKYCTSACTVGADCPNGFACQPIGTPATNVCVKVAEACDADTTKCIVPAACDTKLPLIVNSCTAVCNSAADCPQRAAGLPPWTCDGLCRRPSDVLGPIAGGTFPTQYACGAGGAVVNLCNDGQHIDFQAFDIPAPPSVNCSSGTTTSGKDSDSCVDSCKYRGGCAHGFACTGVGSVAGGRIGLCLPFGAGATGSACQSGLTCEFGYCTGGKCSRDCTADGLCPTGTACVAAGGPNIEGMPFRRCQ